MLVLAIICFIGSAACFAAVVRISRINNRLAAECDDALSQLARAQAEAQFRARQRRATAETMRQEQRVLLRRTLRFSVEEQMAMDGVPIPEPHPWPRPIKPFALDSRHALDLEC